jgi:tRNA 2-thiouridine synthesizing protein A
MSELVDCRGLACPEPVLLTRQALQSAGSGSMAVLVSSGVARDNVSRTARQMGWTADVEELTDGFKINLKK